MSDKKERIDHILTQNITDNKDSAKLNSLLYRDKTKEDKTKKRKKETVNSPQNTSMLSFMWGDDGSSKKRKRAEAKKKRAAAKQSQSTDTNRQQGKTIVRESQHAVEITRDGISLKLGESEDGKLKLKVSTGKRKDISKKRLAKIAMNAIIKELKKEE
ncbi:MAG: hypothetical protein KAJ62_12305 [Desulfobacteraceae bacterium]|nr:hypothetical protein [Desulfobacteraceae bacterium]